MCNIAVLYDRCCSKLPIKKQVYQGIEIFVITGSFTLTRQLIANCCDDVGEGCCPDTTLEICSNQALCIGYSNYVTVHSIVFENKAPIIVRGGGRFIVFHQHVFVNAPNGFLDVQNGCVLLDSPNCCKFVNYGNVEFKSSYLVGQGTVSNIGRMCISSYSKVFIGKEKPVDISNLSEDPTDTLSTILSGTNTNANQSNSNAVANTNSMATSYGILQEYSSRFVNTGVVIISAYSIFEITGTFIQGGDDVTFCYAGNISSGCCEPCDESEFVNTECDGCLFHITGSSKYRYTFGSMADDTFINEKGSSFVSDGDTDVQFLPTPITSSNKTVKTPPKNIIINRGKFTFNGQTVFQNVNVENYSVIQSTYDDITNEFYYGKILFNNTTSVPKSFKNIGIPSILRVAPTFILCMSGFNFLNEGCLIIGSGTKTMTAFDGSVITNFCNNSVTAGPNALYDMSGNLLSFDTAEQFTCSCGPSGSNSGTCQECAVLTNSNNVVTNAKFYFGYLQSNSNQPQVSFSNKNTIYNCQKSVFIFGKNAAQLDDNGTPQVIMKNNGGIVNNGYMQVSKNSLILCTPPLFNNFPTTFTTIENGVQPQNSCNTLSSRAILCVKVPNNRNCVSGGRIEIVSNSSNLVLVNNQNGILADWLCQEPNNIQIRGISPAGAITNNGGQVCTTTIVSDKFDIDDDLLSILNSNNSCQDTYCGFENSL